MSKGEPIKNVNYLSCLIHPIIYYCQKLVELVIAWDGQGMTTQIRIGEAISFWETRFDSLGKQKPKNVGHSTMLSRWHVFLTIFPSRELSQASRTSCVCFHPMFLVVGFIFPWIGGHFCNAKDWVGFPHVFRVAGAFCTHIFAVSCVFNMVVKCFC